ncbi:phosphoribosylformylglycinamidine cyclo-ligase [Deferribacter autotrophicus]|uniref:Phosphoribosylformylglycinamidine cyclo-ligase n=1 Tax=Deferribacter autotrophicus TaxID=500465 RepID=A0A5A8F5M5_9BACT|nr:phosphoribosylformylglycinamidine cyclo-ligase [Deferribacter autotrophicus]KAA0258815.1 phosphoribosylformylglycinamidine cyclo-ligase [Deferribacter autotrophicus]
MDKLNYKKSGVNIDEGNLFVKKIKGYVESTFNEHVPDSIGGFAGLFDISFIKNYKKPLLVSGTDGVGTKLKVAFMAGRYDTIGIDLVAMCVNDVIVTGAKPLFFLDYLATGKLDSSKMADVVKGIAEGCKEAETALIGGETAEMPGMYGQNEFDLAGFCVGVVDAEKIIDGKKISENDVVIGIKSNGYHSNGYSLLRKIYFDYLNLKIDDKINDYQTVADILLKPTKIYYQEVKKLLQENIKVKGMAHITGGGFYENIPRILPDNCSVKIFSEKIPELFEYTFIKQNTNIENRELYRVFNMGIGLIVVVAKEEKERLLNILNKDSTIAYEIGFIEKGDKTVKISGVDF